MQNKLTKSIMIESSDSDYASTLSYPDIIALCMDIATEHSELLGYDGLHLAPRGLFWLATKYRLQIYRRPKQGEKVELSTWPEKPNRIRGIRNFTYEKDGERLIDFISEWAVIDRNSGKLVLLDDLYKPGYEFYPEKLPLDGFYRFMGDFTAEPFGEYTVRSIDIDFEGHMNNVAYARAMFGLFSRKELEEIDPSEVELYFKSSCYEGDRLIWRKRSMEDGIDLRAELPDGTAIFYGRIK